MPSGDAADPSLLLLGGRLILPSYRFRQLARYTGQFTECVCHSRGV
jgi:hypothetical protein